MAACPAVFTKPAPPEQPAQRQTGLAARRAGPGAGAQPAQRAPPQPDRELPGSRHVLSGGGARGLAHIGFLYTLESMNIPIDFIGGTSAGGILAAFYGLHNNVLFFVIFLFYILYQSIFFQISSYP